MGTVNVVLGEDTRLNLILGQQLENAVTEVVFDFSAWKTTYGTGTLALSVQRPGDDQPYAVTLTTSGTDATWSVTNLDTAYKGVGHIQLTYTVGTAIKKSVVYKFTVYESLGANGEYPSPGQTWQQNIEAEIGTLSNLPTTDKSSLVASINEIDGDITDVKQDLNETTGYSIDGSFVVPNSAIEQGAISSNGSDSSSTTRLRTKKFPVKSGSSFVFSAGSTVLNVYWYHYSSNGTVTHASAWLEDGATVTFEGDGDVRFMFKATGSSTTITVSDYDAITEINTTIKNIIDILNGDLSYLFLADVDLTEQLVLGYITTNQSVGSTVPTTINSSSTDKCGIFPCRRGDVFTITGKGGQTNRTWAFTDINYKMLLNASGSATCTDLELTATQDGYFFFNSETAQNPSVEVSRIQIPTDKTLSQSGVPADAKAVGDILNIKVITNPYDFAWFYGDLSSTNHYTYSDEGLVNYEPIHVQAGSSVSVETGGGIKFNAYLIYDDGTTAYKAYNANALSISKSGYLRIGVGKSNGADTNNMAILDGLVLSLIINKNDVPTSPFLRDGVMMGIIPSNNYVGKHTDSTGFNQTTEYDTVIQKWRDLPTLASGYISETDYGAIYTDGPHQYGYKLTPPNRGLLDKKLPHVFLVTSLHGHEKSATYGLLYLIEDMLNHSMEDPVLFYLRNFVQFTILPMANPYGWNANSSLGTHGGIRQNENGVNLNRNFGTSTWANFDNDPEYTTPGEYNYRGTGEFSEIETQNIKDALIATHSDISLVVDIHTYGTDTTSLVSITFVGVNRDTDKTMQSMPIAINQYLSGIKNHMDELYAVNLGLDKVYGSASVDSSVNMTLQDYGYDAFRLPSLTLEVPCGSTNGYLGTDLSKYSADIIKLCGEMIGNCLCKALWYINDSAN